MTRSWHDVTIAAAWRPDSYTLRYLATSLIAKQARHRNRVVLRPDIDFDDYRCEAVIDWIELVFVTERPTQWKWIRAAILKAAADARLFVKVPRCGETGDKREFHVRFQDPSAKQLLRAEQAIRERWNLAADPIITGLEISVDFRPRAPSDELLARMFAVLVRSHLPNRDVISNLRDRPRCETGATRHVLPYDLKHPERNDELLMSTRHDQPAVLDGTYYVGEEESSSAWRTMIKVMDQQNKSTGTRKELPAEEQRVRIEVTLQLDELARIGIVRLADLLTFRFQTLQGDFFKFRLPTFVDIGSITDPRERLVKETLEQDRLRKFLGAGVVGLKAMDDAREALRKARRRNMKKALGRPLETSLRRAGTGSASTLVVYDKLTTRAITALRRLGERVRADVTR